MRRRVLAICALEAAISVLDFVTGTRVPLNTAHFVPLLLMVLSAPPQVVGPFALVVATLDSGAIVAAGTPLDAGFALRVVLIFVGCALAYPVSVGRARLRRTERELTGILEALADSVRVEDRAGRTVYANRAAPTPVELTDERGRVLHAEDLPGRRIFAGESAPEPLLARRVDPGSGRHRWTLTRAAAIAGPDGRPALAVTVVEDVTESRERELATQLLARAGEVLGASLELEETLDRMAALVVPDLADWCSVELPRGDGTIEIAAAAHADFGRAAELRASRERIPLRRDDVSPIPTVLRGAPTVVTNDIDDAGLVAFARDDDHLVLLRSTRLTHSIVVPMRLPGAATIGALTLMRAAGRPGFSAADVALAEELARRAATAVLNARLYRASSVVAATLQRTLLPPELPEIDGIALDAYYEPVGEAVDVGGDFYDVHPLAGGWLFVMGDVTGKGPAAAALTGLARAAIESVVTLTAQPELALAHLDSLLARRGELALCSVCCVHLRFGAGRTDARILTGGHPPPLLIRDGAVRAVGRPGPLLGALPAASWPVVDEQLVAGDVIVLRTDGVTDVVGRDGARFGEERLRGALAGLEPGAAAAAVTRVRRAVDAFAADLRDDQALLAIGLSTERVPTMGDLRFGGSPQSVAVARSALDRAMDGRLEGALLQDARLMLSELASNAVRHGHSNYRVDVDLDAERLRVAVHDGGPGFVVSERAAAGDPGPKFAEGGRGLAIVARLASRWGVERADDGSVVWFELDR